MVKKKCCLKHEKKGKKCKSCPVLNLEEIFKDELKKKEKKKKKDKKKKLKKEKKKKS